MIERRKLGPVERRAIEQGSHVERGRTEARVDALALGLYSANTRWTAVSVVVAVLVVETLLWRQSHRVGLVLWACMVIAPAVLHAVLASGRPRLRIAAIHTSLWASLWLSAAVLGFGIIPLLSSAPVADLAAILTLLAVVGILALSRMTAVSAPFIGFSILALGPPAVWVMRRGADQTDGVLAVLGAGALAFLAVLLIAHRTLHQALYGSLWKGMEQRLLLERLERFNRELYDDRALLQTESRTDPLTAVSNRRALEETLETEWSRCRREKQPLSCVMIDIDHFKSYNDCHGHDGGDECLRQIGRVLKQSLRRAGDLAARYGGEEFVLLLPNTDLNGALVVAEQVREAVAALQIAHQVSPAVPYVTISVGAASVVPDESILLQELPKAADLALYEAKRQGRNCSVGADEQMRVSARMVAQGMIG